jgi:hypothetical protein
VTQISLVAQVVVQAVTLVIQRKLQTLELCRLARLVLVALLVATVLQMLVE